MKITFDDKNTTVSEVFELLNKMELSENDRFPAEKVFHRDLRNEGLEQKSLDNSISITARDGDILVGFVKLVTDKSYIYYILDVMVLPEYRRKEIARNMINEAVNYAKKTGFIKIFLTSLPGKEKYYESFGFKEGMSKVLTVRGEDYV